MRISVSVIWLLAAQRMKPVDDKPLFKAIIVMGVSGCGKTTIAARLAEKLGWTFIESDSYHSEEHIRKMASGIPLTDADRQPWLETLACACWLTSARKISPPFWLVQH